jgi:hypothetical protein
VSDTTFEELNALDALDALEAPDLTADDLAVIEVMQTLGAIIREDKDSAVAKAAYEAFDILKDLPEARALWRKISDAISARMDEWEDEHPDSSLPHPEVVLDHAVRQTFVAAADYRPPARRVEPLRHPRPALARRHGRSARSRRKALRIAVGSSSGGRGDPRREDEPPAPRLCKCGCGDPIPAGKRRHAEYIDATHRQRGLYRRQHPPVAKPEAAKPPTFTPAQLVELRDRVHEQATRRLEVRCALPGANGTREQLLDELHGLEDEIDRTWAEIRCAEAVAS